MTNNRVNELTADLQAFVLDLAAHQDSPPSPAKTAEHYQLRARVQALRAQILAAGARS